MATMISSPDASRGMILEIDGSLWTVLDRENFKTGKGNSEARVRMKIRALKSGYTQDRTFRTDEKVAKATVQSKVAQYTYNEGNLYHFMDMETYDDKIVSSDLLGNDTSYLTDGIEVELLIHEDEAVAVQLPTTVELEITDTEPGFRGDTASAGSKKATLSTGLTVDVPMFLSTGDRIRVDTRNGTYVSRV